jgi:hypothetical protein
MMGMWTQFVAVGNGTASIDDPRLTVLGRQGEWLLVRLPEDWSLSPSEAVGSLAAKLRAPAIGGYVADSDAAACWFAPPGGAVAALAINPSYDDSDAAHTRQWIDADQHLTAARALSQWAAQYAPRKPSAGEIVERLAELEDEELSSEVGIRSLVCAEDGLRVIFNDLLGITDLDETVFAA